MYGTTFWIKRVHLGSVALGKRALEVLEHMTPARYDLLYVLRTRTNAGVPKGWPKLQHVMWQSEIRRYLGLHRSTVSKMVKRLVEIGWLTREAELGDARMKLVALTEAGLQAINIALKIVKREKTVRRWFEDAFKKLNRAYQRHADFHYFMISSDLAGDLGYPAELEYPVPWNWDH